VCVCEHAPAVRPDGARRAGERPEPWEEMYDVLRCHHDFQRQLAEVLSASAAALSEQDALRSFRCLRPRMLAAAQSACCAAPRRAPCGARCILGDWRPKTGFGPVPCVGASHVRATAAGCKSRASSLLWWMQRRARRATSGPA